MNNKKTKKPVSTPTTCAEKPPADKSAVLTAIATVVLAITSGVSICLLANQVSEMRLDQRAWVGIDKLDKFDFKPGPEFSIPLDMINTGKTPAVHVKTKTALKSLKKGDAFVATYTGHPTPYKESNSVVLPQQHMTMSTPLIDVSAAQYDDIKNGRGILYAYADITYNDIYGKSHETTFCVMYYPELTAPSPCDVYNDAH